MGSEINKLFEVTLEHQNIKEHFAGDLPKNSKSLTGTEDIPLTPSDTGKQPQTKQLTHEFMSFVPNKTCSQFFHLNLDIPISQRLNNNIKPH